MNIRYPIYEGVYRILTVLEKVGIRECKVFRGNTTRRAGDFRRKQEA